MFSREFCEVFKKTLFYRTYPVTASEGYTSSQIIPVMPFENFQFPGTILFNYENIAHCLRAIWEYIDINMKTYVY